METISSEVVNAYNQTQSFTYAKKFGNRLCWIVRNRSANRIVHLTMPRARAA